MNRYTVETFGTVHQPNGITTTGIVGVHGDLSASYVIQQIENIESRNQTCVVRLEPEGRKLSPDELTELLETGVTS